MCVKLPFKDLNPDSCPPPQELCTCGVTITPKVHNGI